jgi:hypothetical protein
MKSPPVFRRAFFALKAQQTLAMGGLEPPIQGYKGNSGAVALEGRVKPGHGGGS